MNELLNDSSSATVLAFRRRSRLVAVPAIKLRPVLIGELEEPLLQVVTDDGLVSVVDIKSCIECHIRERFAALPVAELGTREIVEFLRGVERNDPKRRWLADRCKWILSRLWKLAVDLGHVDEHAPNPVHAARWKRPPRPPRDRIALEVLTLDEMRAMISSPRLRLVNRRLWTLLLLTGCRIGEAVELRATDVRTFGSSIKILEVARSYSRKRDTVSTTKTGVVRLVPIHPELVGILPKEGLLAPPPRGKPRWLDKTVLGRWHRDLETMGFAKRRVHATRHTFISQLLNAGAPERTVRSFTHPPSSSKKDSFADYAHLDIRARAEAMAMLKLPPAPEATGQLELGLAAASDEEGE